MSTPERPPPVEPSHGGWSGEPEPDPAGSAENIPATHRYTRGGLVGRGGMGRVYVAQDHGLGREVALKELDPSLKDVPRAVRRLAREAWITARLDHPSIVAVHDIGTLADGRPFYTMRLVKGRSLARALEGEPDRQALLRHVLAVAEAVASAHDAGIVHRDLKPANILLGGFGETQVIDWGLATPTPAAVARWASLPPMEDAGVVGTPTYMSPAQAAGASPDPRDDVWSLGIILREVLVAPGSSPPPDLLAVVARALAPPHERYPDADAFAADLLSWFEGRRVSAHTYSPRELLTRFVRAWRVPLGVAAVGLTLLAGAVGFGWWNAGQERDRARVAETQADAAREAAERNLARAWVEQAVAAEASGDRALAERRASAALSVVDDPQARGVLAAFGRAARPRVRAATQAPTCSWSSFVDDRTFLCSDGGQVAFWRVGEDHPVWTVPSGAVSGGWSLDRAHLLLWDVDGGATIVDPNTGAQGTRMPPNAYWLPQRTVRRPILGGAAWPPDGLPPPPCVGALNLLAFEADLDGFVGLCADGRLLRGTLSAGRYDVHPTGVSGDHEAASVLPLPDGDLLVGTLRGGLRRLDPTGGTRASTPTDRGSIVELQLAPDGASVAVSGTRGPVGVWSVATGRWLTDVPAARPRAIHFAADGTLLVNDGTIRRWALPTTSPPAALTFDAGIADVEVSADGEQVAIATGDGHVYVHSTTTGTRRQDLTLGAAVIKGVAFDGPDAVYASVLPNVGLVRADLLTGNTEVVAPGRPLRRLARLADGSVFGAALYQGLVLWPAAGALPHGDALVYSDVEPLPGAESVVTVDATGRVQLGHDAELTTVVTRPEARQADANASLVAVSTPNAIELYDHDGHLLRKLDGAELGDVSLSADGRLVAAGALDGRARVWDAATGELLAVLAGHNERISAVELAPDATWLVTGSWDHTIRFWDLTELRTPAAELEKRVRESWGEE